MINCSSESIFKGQNKNILHERLKASKLYYICKIKNTKNMAENLFSKITTFINRAVDVISQGNFERVMILNQYNITFKEAYLNGDLNIL